MVRSRALILAAIGMSVIFLSGCQGNQDEDVQIRTAVIESGPINELIIVTGNVQPALRSELRFAQTGIVKDVFVQIGDEVSAGDVLASLDMDDLELSVKQAEISLNIQQISYERLLAPPSDTELAAARAAVNSAVASYNSVDRPPDPESLASAEMQVEQSYLQYQQLQNTLEDQWQAPQSVLTPLQERVQQSLIGVEIARLRLEQLRSGPDANSLAAASASVWQASSQLNGLMAPPSQLEIEKMEIQLEQAELSLQKARQLLESRMIIAPFSGVVTGVTISPDNIASTSIAAITMIDRRNLHVQGSVDEMDVGRIIPGQPALISFDALPGIVVKGQVSRLSAIPQTSATGVVSYEMIVNLEDIPPNLLPGFTATISVIINSIESALLVPNWAVRFNRETGQAFINVLSEEGELTEQAVTLGLRGDDMSEILSGLEEGMTVGVSLVPESISPLGGGMR